MNKYNPKGCPKCGHKNTVDKWFWQWGDVGEIIERKCANCFYYWQERPLDYRTPKKKIHKSSTVV